MPFSDWINAATAPGGDGVYFLGAFDRRITFYSQQVRGLRLAHALEEQGLVVKTDKIAVVGAGAAGLSFALCAALLGYNVTLYDPANQALQLQSASPRLLHPHIYEWPNIGSLDDRAGLPLLDWNSNTGGSVSSKLQNDFAAAVTRLPHLQFQAEHKLVAMEKADADWRLTIDHKGIQDKRRFQKVILAMGFGEEFPCGDAEPVAYWKPSGVGTAAIEPHSGASYLVSGNGDGGLTDILSLLNQNFEHVSFTRDFLSHISSNALRQAALDALDAATSSGDLDLEPVFHNIVRPIINEYGVIDALRRRLRKDRTLTINSDGPLFAPGKASLLNQCMVFATLEAAKLETVVVNHSSGRVTNVEKTVKGFSVTGPLMAGHPLPSDFGHVILRHGPDRATRYASAKASFDLYEAHIKALLKSTPSLADPPTLDPQLYDRFEDLKIEQLVDTASQAGLRQQQTQDRLRIVLEIDAAAHLLVERGHVSLLDVADQCERLMAPVTIHLALPPSAVPDGSAFLRLSRASNGRIHLTTVADHAAAWTAIAPAVTVAATGDPRYRGRVLDPSFLQDKLDACFLRLLNGSLMAIIASGTCTTLHKIDGSIRNAVASTWGSWAAALQGAAALRFDFLRWLANIEQGTRTPWSGDHAQLPRMAAALLLVLATHLEEPLTPASIKRGNLTFSGNAEALGSGCDTIEGGPLTVWDRPDQWNVDALILAGSAEVEVVEVYSPDDTVLNAGSIGLGMRTARRVRPAIIRNDRAWREKLNGPLAAWKQAVQQEFEGWRQRLQDVEDEVSQ
ncbi:ABC-three component system protein [Caballeronia novacaledonica]|uniref:FAD-dependent oxidoreductase n=1 Tax=Caballeronia novacaledonica TaxID=1544861 RepID=A0AA37IDY5_9BURK|nr:ABC-three component system protein [Caballeronia novacaledonica]GJH26979.1 FAD-dependent oxidoreductase [Caballeronia novacaledonica]